VVVLVGVTVTVAVVPVTDTVVRVSLPVRVRLLCDICVRVSLTVLEWLVVIVVPVVDVKVSLPVRVMVVTVVPVVRVAKVVVCVADVAVRVMLTVAEVVLVDDWDEVNDVEVSVIVVGVNVRDAVELLDVGVVAEIDDRVVVVVGGSHRGLSWSSSCAHIQVLGLGRRPPLMNRARSELSVGASITRDCGLAMPTSSTARSTKSRVAVAQHSIVTGEPQPP
jgi:hypothetical protein